MKTMLAARTGKADPFFRDSKLVHVATSFAVRTLYPHQPLPNGCNNETADVFKISRHPLTAGWQALERGNRRGQWY